MTNILMSHPPSAAATMAACMSVLLPAGCVTAAMAAATAAAEGSMFVSSAAPAVAILVVLMLQLTLNMWIRRRRGEIRGRISSEERGWTWTKKKKEEMLTPPGPKGWPIVGNLFQLGAQPHRTLMRLHEVYGPLVRLKLGCVNIITTCDPDIIKDVLYGQDEVFADRPQTLAIKYLAYDGQDVAMARYGPHWKNMRRICMEYLLTTRRLDSYHQHRAEEAIFMVQEVWRQCRSGDVIKVKEQLANFSMNVMTRMLLGKRYFGREGAGAAEALEFLEITEGVFYYLGLLNIGDYLPFLRPLDIHGHERAMRLLRARMDAFHSSILAEHRAKHRASSSGGGNVDVEDGSSHSHGHNSAHSQQQKAESPESKQVEDFVDILLSLPGFNGEPRLRDTEMKALIQDMIAAAIDTSSVLSEWAMAELVRHPEVLRKAQLEMEMVVGKGRLVREEDVGALSYLKCVVKETFRMHPSGPFIIPHEATRDTQVAGYYVPKGTQLLVNVYALGRSPSMWPHLDVRDVDNFRPDRWLTSPPDNTSTPSSMDIRDDRLRILPFSLGRRKCPGAPLGQCMVLLALASLLHSFDWALPPPLRPEQLDMEEGQGLTMPRAQPLLAVATPRLPLHLYDDGGEGA